MRAIAKGFLSSQIRGPLIADFDHPECAEREDFILYFIIWFLSCATAVAFKIGIADFALDFNVTAVQLTEQLLDVVLRLDARHVLRLVLITGVGNILVDQGLLNISKVESIQELF